MAEARVVSIGPVTSETLRDLGFGVDVEADRHDPDGLLQALVDLVLGIAAQHSTGGIPDVRTLDEPFKSIFEHAFGTATGHLFLVAVPFAALALVLTLFIHEVPLRTTVLRDDELAKQQAQQDAEQLEQEVAP